MKKSIFILAAFFAALFANAQTYTIVSRSNDTIKLQSNKLGEALKSVVPGKTSYQLRFIRVIMADKAKEINRKEVIEDFELGSSANIATIKKALQKKELIDIEGKNISFSDPIFFHWLHQNMYLFS